MVGRVEEVCEHVHGVCPGYLTGNPIIVCSAQASGTAQLPEAAQNFILNTMHPSRCEPFPDCPRYCRNALIGGEHALSCLTFQLTRILTLGNRVVPVCLAIVCMCLSMRVLPGVRMCALFEEGILHLWIQGLGVHPLDWGRRGRVQKTARGWGTQQPGNVCVLGGGGYGDVRACH